jgi:hypothetical protein
LNELFNDAIRTSDVILVFEEQYKDVGYQVYKVLSQTVSENPQENKVGEICFYS